MLSRCAQDLYYQQANSKGGNEVLAVVPLRLEFMIVAKLRGGLGNQMFQYAFGRALAHIHRTTLFLDPTGLSSDMTPRRYELDVFTNLKAKLLEPKDRRAIADQEKLVMWFEEVRPGFCDITLWPPSIRAVGLRGFWQSEKYFRAVAPMIRNEFFIDEPNDESIKNLNTSIESVCVHVRRGDYMTSGTHLGFVGCDYYQRAIDCIIHHIKEHQFFVFSDDIPWCREHLPVPQNTTFVERRTGSRPGADLSLMSRCRHYIIANSSFSWWAAWLSFSSSKVVIAPRRWFASNEYCSKDVVPDEWIQL